MWSVSQMSYHFESLFEGVLFKETLILLLKNNLKGMQKEEDMRREPRLEISNNPNMEAIIYNTLYLFLCKSIVCSWTGIPHKYKAGPTSQRRKGEGILQSRGNLSNVKSGKSSKFHYSRVSTKLEKDWMKNTWVKTTLPRNLEIVFSVWLWVCWWYLALDWLSFLRLLAAGICSKRGISDTPVLILY